MAAGAGLPSLFGAHLPVSLGFNLWYHLSQTPLSRVSGRGSLAASPFLLPSFMPYCSSKPATALAVR